jgi:hypothetical protein
VFVPDLKEFLSFRNMKSSSGGSRRSVSSSNLPNLPNIPKSNHDTSRSSGEEASAEGTLF